VSEIIVSDSRGTHGRALINAEPALLWVVVAGTGLAVALVGWFDLALLWYPLRFGDPEWEFGTISAHFDGMPLGTVGLALLVAGAIGRGWRRTSRLLAVVCLLVVVGLLAISVIYLLDVPLALRATAPQIKPVMKKAMLKAGVFSATYTVLYAWLAWFLWRSTRPVKAL
jgi:hypothetical protein